MMRSVRFYWRESANLMSLDVKTKYLDYRVEGLDWEESIVLCDQAEQKEDVMAVNTSGGVVISFPDSFSYQQWFSLFIDRYEVNYQRIN